MKCTIFILIATAAANRVSLLQKFVVLKDEPESSATDQLEWYQMDDSEASRRGAVCMDGRTPGFYYKPGAKDDKWMLSLEGGQMFCTEASECHNMTKNNYIEPQAYMHMTFFEDAEFKDYHQVQLHHCDGGMWMGDRTDPLVFNGNKIYLRGKRILDYTIDYLSQKTPFGNATDLMLTGGSGGAQATYLLADYLKSIIPKSVTKFGSVPMSGWYNVNSNAAEWVYNEHAMGSVIAPGCAAAFSENERHNCLEPRHAYTHSEVPTFVMQVFDSQSINSLYSDESTLMNATKTAWFNCIEEQNGQCTSADVNYLQNYLDNYTTTIKSIDKITKNGEGGFISTCKKHVFYSMEEYNQYEIDGVSMADAVKLWWKNIDRPAQWYWPCTLNTHGEAQCESSCAFDTCKLAGVYSKSC